MATRVKDGGSGIPGESPVKSATDQRHECTDASSARPEQGRWEVEIHFDEHQISRTATYHGAAGAANVVSRESEVIWLTWPATIEEEAEVATSPLTDLQHYWVISGNRLRESAKWMAAVLGAALAAIVGTSPSADLSSHHLRLSAAVIGLAGLSCLAVTMLFILRVMQSPEVTFDQIETAGPKADGARLSSQGKALERWRRKVETHTDLYLPCEVSCLGELRSFIKLEQATLVKLSRFGEHAVGDAKVESLRSAQEARAARLLELRTAAARITAIGEYYAIQVRSTQARDVGTAFAFLGTALIVLAFAWPLAF
jgi:hypothetical protein